MKQHPAILPSAADPAVVLLGASNLTRGISTVVDGARALLGGPLVFYAALGHGRSYGMQTAIFYRELPGIRQCGLWEALRRRPKVQTHALLADVGNDLIYGATLPAIESWLRFCLDQLAALEAQTVMVQLPLARIRRITKAEAWFVQHVLVRNIPLDLPKIQDQAERLAALMATLAAAYGASLVEQQDAWYGFDPIHYPIRHWHDVWATIMAPWAPTVRWQRGSHPRQWGYIRARVPEQRWLFGREQRGAQPCGVFADGSRLSLY